MTTNETEYDFILTLCEMIQKDGMSFGDAVKMFREEFKVSLTYCHDMGVLAKLRAAFFKKDLHPIKT